MINILYSPTFLLSIILIVGLLFFYSLRIVRPEVSKEEDIFLTSLGLIYSCIILVHGWRLDPILFFSQVLLVCFVLAIGWENIRLRGILIEALKNENNKFDNF
jgi:hypothetical protein